MLHQSPLEIDSLSTPPPVPPSRWASEREVLLAEELAPCTFAPKLPTRRLGKSRREAIGANAGRSCSPTPPRKIGTVENEVEGQEDFRVGGCVGPATRPQVRARRHQQAVVTHGQWLSSRTAEVGREEGRQEFEAQDSRSEGSFDSDGTARRWASNSRGLSGARSRRQAKRGNCSTPRDEGDFSVDNGYIFQPVEGDGGGSTAATVPRGGVPAVGSSLPEGWTAFTSPEGWEYFFHNETRVVQWKRPTR